MLFLLTGDAQTGKTRWLEHVLVELAAEGVECCGVVAPGVWRPRGGGEASGRQPVGAGCGAFEKLGIDNVLLPQGERLAFARRRDLAEAAGTLDPRSQSAAAGLAWEISDAAIARVNGHFAALGEAGAHPSLPGRPRLLVVDEVGRLELECGGGLTAALELLDRGATARFPHALVVVRARLLAQAEGRLAAAWGGARAIAPGDGGRAAVRTAFCLASLIDNKYH